MSNLPPFNTRLTKREEIKFRELTDKILAQQSLPEVLPSSEKEEFFQLLQKLELLPESFNLYLRSGLDNSIFSRPKSKFNRQEENRLIALIFYLLSFVAVFLVVFGIPIAIGWIFWVTTKSPSFTVSIFTVAVSGFFGLALMAFFGRFQWTWFFGLVGGLLLIMALFYVIRLFS